MTPGFTPVYKRMAKVEDELGDLHPTVTGVPFRLSPAVYARTFMPVLLLQCTQTVQQGSTFQNRHMPSGICSFYGKP